MSKKDDDLTLQDGLDILQDALRVLRELGLIPQYAERPAKGTRPEGVLLFLPSVGVNEQGRFDDKKEEIAPLPLEN